jgi:hypothetical protein
MLGRAATVGTEIAYRDRGLQRAIFGLIHARSTVRGHLLQGITGINYFYRQFGYEHAIDLEASRHVYFAALPSLKTAESAPYALRPAVATDIPSLIDLAAHERESWQTATVLDEQAWRWMLFASDRALSTSGTVYMITTAEGATIGYILLDRRRAGGFDGDSIGIWGMAVKQGISLAEAAPYALCALRDLVNAFPFNKESAGRLARFRLEMGPGHALFEALGPEFAPINGNHYAWWMRIPSAPAFILHIASVLEQRLADSLLAGYTGEMTIDFYRGGLRLVFAQGKLVSAEDWQKPLWEPEQTRFPRLVFTKLLLGYRSYSDLSYAFEDVWADHADRLLLATVFPPRPSYMLPLT